MLRDKLKKNVARISGPLRKFRELKQDDDDAEDDA